MYKYILMGSGSVGYTGDSPFITDITMKMINVETGRPAVVLNWSGVGLHVRQVIKSLGKKILETF